MDRPRPHCISLVAGQLLYIIPKDQMKVKTDEAFETRANSFGINK